MSKIIGRFIWHELLTTTLASSADFYSEAIGWNLTEMSAGGVTYKILATDVAPVAALIDTAASAYGGPSSGWIGYVGVEDVDAVAAGIKQHGGTVLQAPAEAPEIGRFAVVADPQGAPFGLFAPTPDNPGRDQIGAGTVGHVAWHELYTPDPEAIFAFYADLFGWTKGPRLEMGPAGPYQIFEIDGQPSGGIMRNPDWIPRPVWNPFIQVGDVTAAEARTAKAMGVIVDGPREVPGGDWTLKCRDPQGAMFALVGRKA